MKNVFEQLGFDIELTKDSSPTLRIKEKGESMHHSAGAATETQYIYKMVLDQALDIVPSAKTCVIGLGLAYIEISWALHKLSSPGELTSFEINQGLQAHFLNWIKYGGNQIYTEILKYMSQGNKFDVNQIKEKLKLNYEVNKIESDLLTYKRKLKWNIICYDAFSSKTNNELWQPLFLESFLSEHAAEDCVFTTYACTGVLKRALLKNNFHLVKRPGLYGKRDSTLALRGIFKDCWPYQIS